MPDFDAATAAEFASDPAANPPEANAAPSLRPQSELTALRVLAEGRARQRNLQHEVASKAEHHATELGILARAADLGMLATYLELTRAEARLERERWEPPRTNGTSDASR